MWKFCSIDRIEANALKKNLKQKQANLLVKLEENNRAREEKMMKEKLRKENEVRQILHLFSPRIY